MIIPNIFVWNCRGAGSVSFMKHFLYFVKMFSPSIVILLETSVPGNCIEKILKRTALSKFTTAEANGSAGGISVIWDDTEVTVEPISWDDQVVQLLIKQDDHPLWFLSAIYASPKPNFRTHMWHYLRCIGTGLNLPWLLTGDFNQVLEDRDKRGGRTVKQCRVKPLCEMLESCELMDMGFVGPRFTWSNMRASPACIEERLDRCF